MHLIILKDVEMQPGQEAEVKFSIQEKINESLCYLDISEEERQEKYGKFVLNVDKRLRLFNASICSVNS